MDEESRHPTDPDSAAEDNGDLATVFDGNNEMDLECDLSEIARVQIRTAKMEMDNSTVETEAAAVVPNDDHEYRTRPPLEVNPTAPDLLNSPVTPQRPGSRQTPLRAPGSAPAIVIHGEDTTSPVDLDPRQGRRIRGLRTVSAPNLTRDTERARGYAGTRGTWAPEMGVRFGDRRQDDEASTLVGTPPVTPSPTRARRGVTLKPGPSSPAQVDSQLRVCLREPVKPGTGTGYVYVAISPDRPGLVKIGFTGQEVVQRERSLSGGCRINVTKIRHSPVRFGGYRRVENLAHAELAHFRRDMMCRWCRVVHQEWFEIHEDIAFTVIERWRLFVMQDPWTLAGKLKSFWSQRLNVWCGPAEDEEHDDHRNREQRWESYASLTPITRLTYFAATIHPQMCMLLPDIWRYWCILASLYLVFLLPHHAKYPALLAVTLAGAAHYRTLSSS